MNVNSGRIDISGKKFGRLKVIEYSHTKRKKAYWKYVCDCENICIVEGSKLRNGHTKSCGCILKEINRSRKINDDVRTRLYKVWRNMKHRCENTNDEHFDYYGGRGIKVCDEWQDFSVFYNWCVKSGYKVGLTIDRKDPNGNYEPSNCRWITLKEQQRNKRSNVYISCHGETKTISEWSRKIGVSRHSIRYWIDKYSGNGELAILEVEKRVNERRCIK